MNKKYQKPTVAIAHIIPANIIATSPNDVTITTDPDDPGIEAGEIDSKKRKDDKDNVWSEGLW